MSCNLKSLCGAAAKKIDVTEISSDSDSSAGNGESDGTPKPRKKKSKAKPKPVVPVWTKRPPTARYALSYCTLQADRLSD